MRADTALPAAERLLGASALEILSPAVAAAGGRVDAVRVSQLRYDPGSRLVVRYAADITWSDGTSRTETLGALVQPGDLPEGLAVVERDDGARVGVWRYPHDPFLPGLPQAAYPDGARRLLSRLGLQMEAVAVEPVVYRPGSRAVLRLRADHAMVYVKVVPPKAVARLRRKHRAFGACLPVPRCLGFSEPLGLLVLEALPGTVLTRALVDGGKLPTPGGLLLLLEGIGQVELPEPAEPAPWPVAHHGRLLAGVLPGAAAQIADLVAQAGAPHTDSRPQQTVHGDFYPGQILTRGGSVTGLLDVDGARLGRPEEDAAMCIAHLLALGHVHPRAAERVAGYRRQLTALLAASTDAGELQRAVLAALLGLATTPFRRQEPDCAARTERWLALCSAWAAAPAGV